MDILHSSVPQVQRDLSGKGDQMKIVEASDAVHMYAPVKLPITQARKTAYQAHPDTLLYRSVHNRYQLNDAM